MKKVSLTLDNPNPYEEGLALCLGYFDGVHLGHKQIIKNAVNISDYPIGLLTFDKSVSQFLDNTKAKEVLTSLDDKYDIIDRFGVDYLFVLEIDKNFLEKTAEEFIEFLQKMNVKEIFVGEDYCFGKNRKGNVDLLKKHFKVYVSKTIKNDGKKIGTQTIVQYIKDGKIDKANSLLCSNYKVSGVVVEGLHNGESIGFRTANLKLNANYVIPKFGVYKVVVTIDREQYIALANVGIHPTIDKLDQPLIEVHIPDYDSIDYGKDIQVEFISFIRPEIKFTNTKDLINQIQHDLNMLS